MKSNFSHIGLAKLCGWFGITRQACYQNNWEGISTTLEEDLIIQQVKEIRKNTDDTIRLELYKDFKSFNDKWTAGNSIGQRLLLEEFLFLDRANKDIGDTMYLDIKKLLPLLNASNANQNLYGIIALLITGSNIDLRALPSYVNFYGSNFSSKTKIKPSNTVANDLFGKFLEVDYQESSPKIILQYIGETSKYLDLSEINKRHSYLNDGFDVGNVNNNPLIITTPDYFNNVDLSKSNKVVAFEVSFGDQNQNIFKTIQLDQSQFKNTYESMLAIENLKHSES